MGEKKAADSRQHSPDQQDSCKPRWVLWDTGAAPPISRRGRTWYAAGKAAAPYGIPQDKAASCVRACVRASVCARVCVFRCDSVRCSCPTEVLRLLQRSAKEREGPRRGGRGRRQREFGQLCMRIFEPGWTGEVEIIRETQRLGSKGWLIIYTPGSYLGAAVNALVPKHWL